MNLKKFIINIAVIILLLLAFFFLPLYPCKWQSGWIERQTSLDNKPWQFCSFSDTMTVDAYPVFFSIEGVSGFILMLVYTLLIIILISYLINKLLTKKK